jgi:hypothetical protein
MNDIGMTDRMSSQPRDECRSFSTAALYNLRIEPISATIAKDLVKRNHYLHSFPGGTMLCLGVFAEGRLMGSLTLGAGPFQAHSLVKGAERQDCVTLTRLWLSDTLPFNSESKVLGMLSRALRQNTGLKFIFAYADPAAGHVGIIYQAAGWLYTGLSSAIPLYDIGDGIARHSRSVGHLFGSHSVGYFARHGIKVNLIPQAGKHRYVKFLCPGWNSRLLVPVLPFPRKEAECGNK